VFQRRDLVKNLVLLLAGAAGGYWFALHGRSTAKSLPLSTAADLPHRFEHYYRTHPNETIIGAVMLGLILYLAYGKQAAGGGGGGAKGRR
jgi:hypothetical protein